MTAASSASPKVRPIRLGVPTHLFKVGQLVHLKGGFGILALWADIYRITATLPPLGNSPQYRIREYDERYERVATQDTLEPAPTIPAGHNITLTERTCDHGQGTETQQPRDQEAETGKGTT